MKKETSCINAIAILDYLKHHDIDYSGIIADLSPEIDALEDPESFLRDPNNWISCSVISKLFERATAILRDENAAYKMGRWVTETLSLGYAQKIVLKAFWSHKKALKHCQKINDQFNRNKRVELYELKKNGAIIRLHWDPKMASAKHICQYNQGVYTSLPLIWGGSPLTVREKCCHFDGAPYCEYHLKWPIRNKLHEIVSRFFTSRSVLRDIIKEMEEDKRVIEEKTEKLSRMNRELRNEIADRKEMEEALIESESNLQSVFDAVPVGICFMKNRMYQRANQNWCDSFGYTEETLMGKNTEFIYESKEEYERVGKELYGHIREHGIASVRTRLKRRDGQFRDVDLIARPLDARDMEAGTVVVVHDVTQRRRAEEERKRLENQLQQAQKMESIGTLAGGMAHDFNNLLMAIQGRISIMLMDKDASHPDVEYLKGIEGYVENAADLTRQILGFARGGKYEVKPTDLNRLLKNENLMFGRTKKEITIHEAFQKDLWPVDIDRGQIQQVLLNLYVNAWQAMPGGGNLNIKTENVSLDEAVVKPFSFKPGQYVKLSVTDTGVGMDRTTQERIFDPFFTTKEMGRGTGLGLASVYGIIKNHGGFTEVFSKKGHGSTFSIYLPASERHPVEEKQPTGGVLRGSETVLLVDDEPMILEVAESLLRSMGYNVHVAESGQKAVQFYGENQARIDLVILDMIMPVMSGGETYDRIKEINPHVKVLLSSGYSIDGQASEILGRGCQGFIQKPFKTKALSQKLREVLDGHHNH